MSSLDVATMTLKAALLLQDSLRDEPASVRAEAARAVLQARAEVARARAEMAMGGTKARAS